MKHKIIILLALSNLTSSAFSQKPIIDFSAYHKFSEIADNDLSNNGNFAVYSIFLESINKTIIRSTHGEQKIEILGNTFGKFTQDSRSYIFLNRDDSLGILTLGTMSIDY